MIVGACLNSSRTWLARPQTAPAISLSRLLSYNRGAVNTGLVMAGATLAVLPPLILFAFLQRFFVDSIVGSAIKG
ncbi:hypothetical protein RFM98_27380 [Mesorhizobium sp. VK9D]|uniref:hypothetical protein n=1 Tax=Mesorhizobium australafricanum TaxID=3072311 RepID=UPI002A243322|nr:hypothetical protein [Mesorhizobium sp. VK9D]MDX8456464.1 hypothetical protein [Mesorhizobium sp. VK9D]